MAPSDDISGSGEQVVARVEDGTVDEGSTEQRHNSEPPNSSGEGDTDCPQGATPTCTERVCSPKDLHEPSPPPRAVPASSHAPPVYRRSRPKREIIRPRRFGFDED